MGLFSFTKKENPIKWLNLEEVSQLEDLKKESFNKPVLILKHSTRCSISVMAKTRLESKWEIEDEEITPVYLDLLRYRAISDEIVNAFGVMHQSPQVLLIKDGTCVYTTTHTNIDARAIKNEL